MVGVSVCVCAREEPFVLPIDCELTLNCSLFFFQHDENAIRKDFKRRKFIEFIGTDKQGQPIIAIYACRLPERKDLNSNIFIE